MLDATERKTLLWCMFFAGVLCLIPGEIPKGPTIPDYARQIAGRLLEHHATHIAWVLSALLLAHHVWRTKQEMAASAVNSQG